MAEEVAGVAEEEAVAVADPDEGFNGTCYARKIIIIIIKHCLNYKIGCKLSKEINLIS